MLYEIYIETALPHFIGVQVDIKPLFVDANVQCGLLPTVPQPDASVQCAFTPQPLVSSTPLKSQTIYSESEISEFNEEEAINISTGPYYSPLESTSSISIVDVLLLTTREYLIDKYSRCPTTHH